MSAPRFYLDQPLAPGARFSLPPGPARHATRALRLAVDDVITLFNGRGGEYAARIERIHKDEVAVSITGFVDIECESRLRVVLAQGISSGERMDYTLQKAVELGVAAIQPIAAKRSIVKLAGERAIQASGCRHLIFRTSWVYGARGSNFLLTMRRLMRERPELKIVADQVGAPTWCRDLAEATAQVLSQVVSPMPAANKAEPWGIYHMTNAGETSWHGFAQAIQALDASDEVRAPARLLPIPSSDYPTPAKRPLNSRLNNDRLEQSFGLRLQDWRAALALCLEANNKRPQ